MGTGSRVVAFSTVAIAVVAASCGATGTAATSATAGVAATTAPSPAKTGFIVLDYGTTRPGDVGVPGLVNRATEIVTLVPTKTEASSVGSDASFTLATARVETVVRSQSRLSNSSEVTVRQVGSTSYQGVAILEVGVRYLAFLLPLTATEVLGGPGRYLLVREFAAFRQVGTGSYSTDDARIVGRYTDLPARIDMSEVQRLAA